MFLSFFFLPVQNTLYKFAAAALISTLMACSPKFDWREVRGTDAPYTVLLPAKPASFAREMQLDGVHLKMQMTAADADGVSFAVGVATVPDPSQIPRVLEAMQNGMIKNIRGNLAPASNPPGKDIVAYGSLQNGQPVKLVARFVARGNRVYQVVVIGKEKSLTAEVVDTFMTSFKIN